VLLVLAVPGVARVRRDRLALLILVGPPVLATVTVAFTYGNQRFVLDAVPVLCIAAAVSLVHWGDVLVARRSRDDGAETSGPGRQRGEEGTVADGVIAEGR